MATRWLFKTEPSVYSYQQLEKDKPVTLTEVKANKKLTNFDLVRLSRLSIMKVSDDQWKILEGMAER